MTLRGRTVLLTVGALGSLLTAITLVVAHLLLSGFTRIENDILNRNVDRVTRLLAHELDRLDSLAADWALREDIRSQVPNADGQSVFDPGAAILASLRVDVVVLFGGGANRVAGWAFDPETMEKTRLPDALVRHLAAGRPLAAPGFTNASVKGVIQLPDRTFLVAARSMPGGSPGGPPAGAILFGRSLQRVIDHGAGGLVAWPITLIPLRSGSMPSDAAAALDGLLAGHPVVKAAPHARRLEGFALVRDLYDRPAAMLCVTMARDIYVQSLRSLAWMVGWMASAVVACVIVMVVLLERSVLRRLSALTAGVDRIRSRADVSARLAADGADEIATVSRGVNTMLDALEKSQGRQQEAERRLRSLLDAAPFGAHEYELREDGALVFVGANRAADRVLGLKNEQFVGRTIEEAFPGLAGTDIPSAYRNVALNGWRFERDALPYREGPVEGAFEIAAFQTGPRRMAVLFRDVTDRRRAEERLRESEERFRNLVENTTDWIWEIDARGRYTYCSPRVTDLLGYRPEEVVGATPFDFMPADEAARLRPVVGEIVARQGRIESLQNVCLHKDGRRVVMETSGMPVFGHDGALAGYRGIDRDVTERQVAEARRIESEARFRQLFNESPDAVFVEDAEGLVLDVNPAACRLHAMPREQLVGAHVRDLVPPAAREGLMQAYAQVVAGAWTHFDGYSLRSDGTEVPVDITVSRILYDSKSALLLHVRDMSERRAQEESLRQLYAAMREVVALHEVVRDAEGRIVDYRILDCNPAFTAVTGIPRDRAVGALASALYGTGAAPYLDAYARVVETGQPETFEAHFAPMDKYFLVSVFRPAPGRFATVTADVSDRRRAEEDRRKLQEQVLHTQKLESLGVLAGGIAHDFNNILMAILGNADLAIEDLPERSPVRENLQEIETAARRAADLCRQMLAYSGKGRFVIQPVDLNDVVREMTRMLEVSISKKAALRLALFDGLPLVDADATQMRQVVMNLVINASEAIGDRTGVISVTTGQMECDESYLQSTWVRSDLRTGRYVFLEITDSGCGMDRKTQARIFDPFFSTKFAGRGLGLAAVMGIIRGHHGSIKVYSEPGRGSTFKVLLPATGAAVVPVEPPPPVRAATGAGRLVLLVDDEAACRATGRRMLERLGFGVVAAVDGREALDLLRRHGDVICCVLLDLTMPNMDGEETFREMRRLQPGVRVILSSGYNEQDVTQRFVGRGLAGFIQKPYQLAALADTLRDVLGSPPAAEKA